MFLTHPTYKTKCSTSEDTQSSTRYWFRIFKSPSKIWVLKQSQSPTVLSQALDPRLSRIPFVFLLLYLFFLQLSWLDNGIQAERRTNVNKILNPHVRDCHAIQQQWTNFVSSNMTFCMARMSWMNPSEFKQYWKLVASFMLKIQTTHDSSISKRSNCRDITEMTMCSIPLLNLLLGKELEVGVFGLLSSRHWMTKIPQST